MIDIANRGGYQPKDLDLLDEVGGGGGDASLEQCILTVFQGGHEQERLGLQPSWSPGE